MLDITLLMNELKNKKPNIYKILIQLETIKIVNKI